MDRPSDRHPSHRQPYDRQPSDRHSYDRHSYDRKSSDKQIYDRQTYDRQPSNRHPYYRQPSVRQSSRFDRHLIDCTDHRTDNHLMDRSSEIQLSDRPGIRQKTTIQTHYNIQKDRQIEYHSELARKKKLIKKKNFFFV